MPTALRRGCRGSWAAFAAGLMGTLLAAGPLKAQLVRGRVGSADGRPVPQATVSVWRGSTEVQHVETNAEGRFTLTREALAGATAISARAIGFSPRTLPLPAMSPDSLVVALEPRLQPLPEVVVVAAHRMCPNREQPTARALWDAVRSRYVLAALDRSYQSVQRWSNDEVWASEVDRTNDARLQPAYQARHGSARVQTDRWIQDSGYAIRLRPGEPPRALWLSGDEYFAWWYPRLDKWDADHFLRDAFGAHNLLSVEPLPDGGSLLIFCPTRGGRPSIEGTLRIGADSNLYEARWRFVTPKPREDAGGEVVFVPPAVGGRGGPRMLIPLRSLFWRRVGGSHDLYWRAEAIHIRWEYGVSPEILPGRALAPQVCAVPGACP